MSEPIWGFSLADNDYPPNPDLDQPPVKVLDALAAEIEEATGGLLEGDVDTMTLDMARRHRFGRPEEVALSPEEHWRQQSTFVHIFNIGCPRLMYYQFRALSVIHGPHFYPCQIMAPNAAIPWMEIDYDNRPTYLVSANPHLEAQDERQLRKLLRQVMNSNRVYTLINSLLAQAHALEHRSHENPE